jgi:phenylacetic acid degradation operon negative regulatory protein
MNSSNFSDVNPTAKSLVLDLLSTLRRGTMPVGALVEAGRMFGIAENSTRVALTRLRASGRIERDARGRYRLGATAQPVARRVTGWRELERRLRRWDGGWVGLLDGEAAAGAGRGERRRCQRALRLLGFRSLTPSLCVRPDNLRGGVDALRGELAALGLPPGTRVFGIHALDAVTEARARTLWTADALERGHRDRRAEVEASARRLRALADDAAMVESFLLGGRAIRQLVLDPLLPDAIVAGTERRALLEAMRGYDRLGRRAWAGFLARFDVPHRTAPADTGMGAGAERLARRAPGPGPRTHDGGRS